MTAGIIARPLRWLLPIARFCSRSAAAKHLLLSGRNKEWILSLAEAAGTKKPDNDVCQMIIDTQVKSGGVGMTFSWDSDEVKRWCLYSLNIPEESNPDINLSTSLNSLWDIEILNPAPQYNAAWSFSKNGVYRKLEKSYSNDATWFLTHEMGGDLSKI